MQSSSVSPATKRVGSETAAVPADELLDAPAVRRGEDPLAESRVGGAAQLCESSHSCTSPTRFSTSVRCPFTSSIQASAPGMCAASHSPCETGTKRSSAPCTIRVGRAMSPTSKPHGAAKARSSSIQPSAAGPEPVEHVLVQPGGERAGERRAVDRSEERPEELLQLIRAQREGLVAIALDRRPERFLAREHEVELLHVVLAHACMPVEAFGSPRRDACQRGRRDQPVAAERSAGERVRPAARKAPGRIPVEAKPVGNRFDIRDDGGHRSAPVAGGAAVAGAVVADQANAGRGPAVIEEAGARRAVVDDHRQAARVACLVQFEGPAVGGLDDGWHAASFPGFGAARRWARCGARTRGSTATRR